MKLSHTIIALATIYWLVGCGGGSSGQQPPNPTPEKFIDLSGANLPWINYGHDVGLAHTWNAGHDGFSANQANLQADLAFLAQSNVKLVRVFIFCDLRGGIYFNQTGLPTGFDSYVYTDFQTLLNQASVYGLRLIPVIFDFTLADGVANENGTNVGEYPDLITDSVKRTAIIQLMRSFVAKFNSNPTIYAWEIINEPEFATAVSGSAMKTLVQEMVTMIHQVSPKAKVTVGCCNRGGLADWKNVGLDIYQFHYYDNMEGQFLFDYPSSQLQLDKPVLIGEVQPINVIQKLDKASANGYAGVLFWSLNTDYDFRSVATEYKQWMLTH